MHIADIAANEVEEQHLQMMRFNIILVTGMLCES